MKISYRLIMFFLLVIMPLGVVSYYELRLASDRFHSESSISITEDKKSIPTLDLSAIGIPSASGNSDAMTVIEFASSPEMIEYLDQKLRLREHYENVAFDWWSRLPKNASREDFYDYMNGMISIGYDQVSHLIKIKVQAFSREFAQSVVFALLERSQQFVDRLNSKVTEEKIKFLEHQLGATEARLSSAKRDLLAFQKENGILTVETEANLINSSIASLNSALITKQGQLEVSLRELDESAPVVKRLKAEISTLQKQIAGEKERLSAGSGGSTVSDLSSRFTEIQANIAFLETIYKANLAQLEAARVEAAQRLKYLIIVTSPTLADSSLYPARAYNVITAAIVLMMAFFIISLIVAIVREHA